MNIQWLGPAPDSNYTVGRNGNPVSLIVQHWMAGTFEAALARFMNPTSIVSAHYLVGQQRGRIAQLVKDADTAYHAGNFDVNLRSIGIEAEASPTMVPSDDLYANLADLYASLAQTHSLELIENVTVKPHRAIVPTQCPGTIDIGRIVAAATGGSMVSQADFDAYKADVKATIEAMKAAYDPLVHHTHPLGGQVGPKTGEPQ